LGGAGGGGNGALVSSNNGSPATVNTGGGGGGSSFLSGARLGGNGGSGIVIIAYLSNYPDIASFSAGLVVNGVTTTGSNIPASDTVSRSGYKLYKFTAGTGSFTF
jgi:hypothetical protein